MVECGFSHLCASQKSHFGVLAKWRSTFARYLHLTAGPALLFLWPPGGGRELRALTGFEGEHCIFFHCIFLFELCNNLVS